MFCRKFVLIIFGLVNIALALDANTVRKVFISNLLNTIGQNGTVSLEDIRDYLDKRNVFSENSTVEKCTVETNVDPNCILETVSHYFWFVLLLIEQQFRAMNSLKSSVVSIVYTS